MWAVGPMYRWYKFSELHYKVSRDIAKGKRGGGDTDDSDDFNDYYYDRISARLNRKPFENLTFLDPRWLPSTAKGQGLLSEFEKDHSIGSCDSILYQINRLYFWRRNMLKLKKQPTNGYYILGEIVKKHIGEMISDVYMFEDWTSKIFTSFITGVRPDRRYRGRILENNASSHYLNKRMNVMQCVIEKGGPLCKLGVIKTFCSVFMSGRVEASIYADTFCSVIRKTFQSSMSVYALYKLFEWPNVISREKKILADIICVLLRAKFDSKFVENLIGLWIHKFAKGTSGGYFLINKFRHRDTLPIWMALRIDKMDPKSALTISRKKKDIGLFSDVKEVLKKNKINGYGFEFQGRNVEDLPVPKAARGGYRVVKKFAKLTRGYKTAVKCIRLAKKHPAVDYRCNIDRSEIDDYNLYVRWSRRVNQTKEISGWRDSDLD